MVRISGGTLRGRVLQVLPDGWIRPTMGRVREAMFSMLTPYIPHATVLDLFAGCGLLGLEALSRGARSAFFVDLEQKAVQLIKKNVTLCSQQEYSRAYQGSALHPQTLRWVKQDADSYHRKNRPFDVVFLDPPYRKGLVARALQALTQIAQTDPHFLAATAVIVTEQEAEAKIEPLDFWHVLQNRQYGDTRIIFWHRKAE